MEVGVFCVQGGFGAHARALERAGLGPVEVREAADLAGIDGLVFPGGESSVQLKLIGRHRLWGPLDDFVKSGKPVLATCAGLILAAREVRHPNQESFGWLDVSVTRNGYGRQADSFEAWADESDLPLVFIRAPRITEVGPAVRVLATLGGEPVLVQQGAVVGASFHPELTEDSSVFWRAFLRE